MLWFICMILAIGAIVFSLRFFLDKNRGSVRIVFGFLCLVVATYVIYIPPFLHHYNFLAAMIADVINVFQVISLDADYLEYYETVEEMFDTEVLSEIYLSILGILHTAMPILSALTAITVLFKCFSSVQLFIANKSKKPMYIFCEFNDRADAFAKSLKKRKGKIVFANCDEDAIRNDNREHAGYIFKEEKITELNLSHSKSKDIYYLCLCDDEDKSLAASLSLIKSLSKLSPEQQKRVHIFMFSKYSDYSLYIDSADKHSLDVRCVNEYELLVYDLLDKQPLYKYAKDGRIHLLIHGLDYINLTFLKAASWCGQLLGYSLKISVVGVDIRGREDELKVMTPDLFAGGIDLNFYNCESEYEVLQTVKEHCADANYIVVSSESDNETMECSVQLRRLFYKLDEKFENCPPIYAYIRDLSKYETLKELKTAEAKEARKRSYGIIPFGDISDVFTYSAIIDPPLEKLAKNVHLAYAEIFSDGPINVAKELENYNVFEVDKRSNRANALHIRYKLALLGLDYTDEPGEENEDLKEYFNEDTLHKLSVTEHDRWMVFLQSEGWTGSTREQVNAYRESGISAGRHKCPLLQMHPYICGFDELEALSIELEGKDTRVYDIELIRRIPDILGDKWGVAGRKYRIVKKSQCE